MTIRITINEHTVMCCEVINRGPCGGPDGASFERGDAEGGDGLRRYEWRITSPAGDQHGEVLHARGSGARELAVRVLSDITDQDVCL